MTSMYWIIKRCTGVLIPERHQISCTYSQESYVLAPSSFDGVQCAVSKESLKNSTEYGDIPVIFSGSQQQKSLVFMVHFKNSDLDYIPHDLHKIFPKLGGLKITNSPMQKLMERFLHKGLKNLRILQMSNKLHKIQKNAFSELINLEVADLYDNQIEVLPYTLFDHSPELNSLELRKNPIKAINLRFFDRLTKLDALFILETVCVNQNFNNATGDIHRNILGGMKTCFKNCINDRVCFEQSFLVDTSITSSSIPDNSKLITVIETCKSENVVYQIVIAVISVLAIVTVILSCFLIAFQIY